ncbi:MAG TPA: hypothetical protein VL860_02770 [Planctomycetota bacterium]|nr:hypothetical protein [Planctomycetota bacterium]
MRCTTAKRLPRLLNFILHTSYFILCFSSARAIAAQTPAAPPREVADAFTALEAPPPNDKATAETWGAWIHDRSAAKKQLLGAGDLAVDPIAARVRDILGLDRDGREVLQGKNDVLHAYYSILASLAPQTAGKLLLEIAWLRDDHPYQEERAWALWSLGSLTFQEYLDDNLPQPGNDAIHAAAKAAQAWWTVNGAKTWQQWHEDAIARAHARIEGTQPDPALAGVQFLLSQNDTSPSVLAALKSLISGEGRTWEDLKNYHRSRAIGLAVRTRRVEFELQYQSAALSADPAISQAGIAALGAVGTAASLDTLVKLAADPDADKAADALIAGTALTGAWQPTAEEFKLWAQANGQKPQSDWWQAGLPALIDRATKGDSTALSVLYTRVRRPMPPVSFDDLRFPQYGPQLETWQQWYDRMKDNLAWDAADGQVVLGSLPTPAAAAPAQH